MRIIPANVMLHTVGCGTSFVHKAWACLCESEDVDEAVTANERVLPPQIGLESPSKAQPKPSE